MLCCCFSYQNKCYFEFQLKSTQFLIARRSPLDDWDYLIRLFLGMKVLHLRFDRIEGDEINNFCSLTLSLSALSVVFLSCKSWKTIILKVYLNYSLETSLTSLGLLMMIFQIEISFSFLQIKFYFSCFWMSGQTQKSFFFCSTFSCCQLKRINFWLCCRRDHICSFSIIEFYLFNLK